MPLSIRIFVEVVVALFCLYAGALIWSSSFLAEGTRWFALFDDAMISMRYARNFAEGQGLVWNPGERVEGFTNPGWTLIMALIHLLESRENLTSLYVQVLSAICLVGTIVCTAALAVRIGTRSVIAAAVAAAAAAFYFPLNYFSLMGMETGILALLIIAAITMIVRAGESGHASWGAWLILAGAIFVRLDAVVPALALACVCMAVYPANRRANLVFAGSAIAFSLGVQTLLRLWYYGDPLPNTYYLKMTDVPLLTRLGRGLWVTSRYTFNHFWPLYVLVPIVVISSLRNRRAAGDRLKAFVASPAALLLAVVAGQVAYSTYVGGDVWEWFLYANRFLVISAPLLFILLAQLMAIVVGKWSLAQRSMARHPALWAIALSAILIVQSNWHGGFEFAREQATLRTSLYGVSDAKAFVEFAQTIKKTEDQGTTLAIDRAGTLPYFLHGFKFYDILGKADDVIARLPSHSIVDPGMVFGNHFVPGHTKWNAEHTVGKLKPDYVILTVGFMDNDFMPWIVAEYQHVEAPGLVGRVYKKIPGK